MRTIAFRRPLRSSRFSLPSLAVATLLSLTFAPAAVAQGVVEHGQATALVPAEVHVPGFRPDIPMPPQNLAGFAPDHGDMPLQVGPPQPGPNTPPSVDIAPGFQQPSANGVFKYFIKSTVTPSGASRSTTGEPSLAQNRDTAMMTGNWYSALSKDSGKTWSHVNPYTAFPSVDGGFCCDQRAIYVPSQDMTIWLLQYSYSSTTQVNTYRVAITKGRDDLRDSKWTSWRWRPTSFGYPLKNWLDFPDMAVSNKYLYISANVFSSGGSYVGSVYFRTSLASLAAKGSISATYWKNTEGSSMRFAEGGSGAYMFIGNFKNTTNLYIRRVPDSSTTTNKVTRSVGSWVKPSNGNPAKAPGPDGRDWLGKDRGRLRGAYGNSSEIGFLWLSNKNGASRPMPYTRVARFKVSDRTKIAEHDIWSNTIAFAYAAADTNDQGDVGLVAALGSATSYVHSSAVVIDKYQSWGGLSFRSMGTGSSGPSGNRWGDYFDVHQHPVNKKTFIGTGMYQSGGSSGSSNRPVFAWFGRDDYESTWVGLTVRSTPVNASIIVDVTDRLGRKNGTTPYVRSYAPLQGYALTAPATVISGRTTYIFDRWALKVTPTGAFSLKTIGERTLDVTNIGNISDTAEARYVVRRSMAVRSTNPSSGVAITVSRTDLSGNKNGSTSFSRLYKNGQSLSLKAPAKIGFNPFRRWRVNGSTAGTSTTLPVTMTGSRTIYADYSLNVAGSSKIHGAGCKGSSGRTPSHAISWPRGANGPQQGDKLVYRVSSARANSFGALYIGLSDKNWGAIPLPLNLAFIGMNGCFLNHDVVLNPGIKTSSLGTSSLTITYPVSSAAIGAKIYSTYSIVDKGANALGVVHSNSRVLTQGGNK